MRALPSAACPLAVARGTAAGARVLTAQGLLDSSTYRTLRDEVIKAALDEPMAVLVDVDELQVTALSAWSVFTSARWHVSTWPDVPVMLVCSRAAVAAQITRSGITRYVPVHPDVETALRSVSDAPPPRRRARAELPRTLGSLKRSRDFVAECLGGWSQDLLIPTAKVIVDVLVENALRHTESAPVLLLEVAGDTVTIAVQDASRVPAVRHEAATGGIERSSGLAVVGALCRSWGSMPTPNGKTVWAVIDPASRL